MLDRRRIEAAERAVDAARTRGRRSRCAPTATPPARSRWPATVRAALDRRRHRDPLRSSAAGHDHGGCSTTAERALLLECADLAEALGLLAAVSGRLDAVNEIVPGAADVLLAAAAQPLSAAGGGRAARLDR